MASKTIEEPAVQAAWVPNARISLRCWLEPWEGDHHGVAVPASGHAGWMHADASKRA
jgi:hypothetical protein